MSVSELVNRTIIYCGRLRLMQYNYYKYKTVKVDKNTIFFITDIFLLWSNPTNVLSGPNAHSMSTRYDMNKITLKQKSNCKFVILSVLQK